MSLATPTISKVDGVLDLVRPEVLPDRVLVFEESLCESFVDDGDLARGRGVVLGDGPAKHHFRAQGFEEARHHARPTGACIFLGARLRPARDANAVVPTIASHGRVERGSHHPHAGNLAQAIVNLPEQRLHLFRLVGAQHGIDPGDIAALGLKAEILVLQVAQALAQKSRRGQQHE